MAGPSRFLAGVALAAACGLLNSGGLAAQIPADSVPRSSPGCPKVDPLPIAPIPFPWIQSMLPAVAPPPMPNLCGERGLSSGTVRIRGTHLPTVMPEPPYYIDGARVTAAEFGLLRPEQIQSIQVMRGPSILSRYGVDDPGAAVLVITRPAVAPREEAPR